MSLLNCAINYSIKNYMKVFFLMKKDKILMGGGLNLHNFLNTNLKNIFYSLYIFKSIGGIK